MATIHLNQVEKKFGDSFAVKPLDMTIKDGEFVVLLGPSGCGKTTTLRMISGLEAVTRGQILFDHTDVTWLHPSERDIAFVFQFFALYSHLSVGENVAFPLQAQQVPRDEIKKRVSEVTRILKIDHLLKARPGSLSGGDQQRVALARALVRRPAAFLMDEPLGALDAEFRETMRAEIKRLHIDQHATTVYVTHDQIEAMAMGDRIVVMSNATVQQADSPYEVYHNPANLFVARFIGSPGMNLLPAVMEGDNEIHLPGGSHFPAPAAWHHTLGSQLGADRRVIVGFRPEAARIHPDGVIGATNYVTDLHGAYTMLNLQLDRDTLVHARAGRGIDYRIGEAVHFDVDPAMIRFFHPETEQALHREMH